MAEEQAIPDDVMAEAVRLGVACGQFELLIDRTFIIARALMSERLASEARGREMQKEADAAYHDAKAAELFQKMMAEKGDADEGYGVAHAVHLFASYAIRKGTDSQLPENPAIVAENQAEST